MGEHITERKVLLVEDDTELRLLTKTILEEANST
jgi:hypothetical protein